jgi:hypothetical protein
VSSHCRSPFPARIQAVRRRHQGALFDRRARIVTRFLNRRSENSLRREAGRGLGRGLGRGHEWCGMAEQSWVRCFDFRALISFVNIFAMRSTSALSSSVTPIWTSFSIRHTSSTAAPPGESVATASPLWQSLNEPFRTISMVTTRIRSPSSGLPRRTRFSKKSGALAVPSKSTTE